MCPLPLQRQGLHANGKDGKTQKLRITAQGTEPSCVLATNEFARGVVQNTCPSSSALKQQWETLEEN